MTCNIYYIATALSLTPKLGRNISSSLVNQTSANENGADRWKTDTGESRNGTGQGKNRANQLQNQAR